MHLITPVLPGLLFYLRNNKGMSNNRIGEERDSDRRVIPTFTDIKEKRKKDNRLPKDRRDNPRRDTTDRRN
jgi:hypothetical protein